MPKNKDYSKMDVINKCRDYMNKERLAIVIKASNFAERAHRDQMRKSGEPYFMHPVQVAGILAELQMDSDTVATGFLHDVVEDTGISLDDIAYHFSPTIAQLVDGVTKLGKFKFKSHEEQLAENHRKMLLAMANDLRVIMVKLADRLHNMRTLKYHRPEKQVSISKETLEIYAPLADRLGISQIKWELEDIALRYIDPEAYYSIVQLIDSKRNERDRYINNTIEELKRHVAEVVSDDFEIYGRPKHIYSIYRKMKDQNKDFSQIYDLLAIRVVVDSVRDCYAVLGIIHTNWKPMPGRFKDYIAMPKANLYQSLHTTVMGDFGMPVEIQIRTFEMHEVAEYGVAAHWAYKLGDHSKVKDNPLQPQLDWFNQIEELQNESNDATDFMQSVKEDIFKDKVYVFTPKGDVTELPAGSGPLDFAYSIHSEVGNKTVGAKVNNRIEPLNYQLKTGDIVEILTSKNSTGPSRDWINLVTTSRARNKIKRFFKLQVRDENIEKGRQMVEHAVDELGFSFKELYSKEMEEALLARFNFSASEDLFAAVGFGELSTTAVANRITEKERKKKLEEQRQVSVEMSLKENSEKHDKEKSKTQKMTVRHKNGVIVEGANNLLIRLAHCCNPLPGDDIVGYITKGRGVSVHRRDCNNVKLSPEIQDRLIEVDWEDTAAQDPDMTYEVEIEVIAFDRSGLLNEVLQVITPLTQKITNINGNVSHESSTVKLKLKVLIQNINQLDKIIDKINNIPDIYEVYRTES
ncbi:RelA/SpoT family protein [Aerococcus kribbianus]|uniref:GTP diphosphokinase n=1 Tax=Aerococcus kribbianus TaxID=2999064 RepID=A0A9X3FNC5_9LACT|nr:MULTISPECIES: bifunctional (p)ppGpp synthetase/guanosine-3',5'-bis(diphosphate) 3'-pyrophosphohydrolase [unclassified Aerococcus]MCZ0716933.1 bifunctional (p)ppGpp synthetase/guanosine-3',5'-bis(diphosphate) 3'-pyrophosphohydrolase [Aerococcus sp. YH-aer221]MCZ0725221.1 bifunctional (p)ppGpp synthetase/guanosine-3',5'-bis(diphosphate) 3'-pyrophosphohydrolase [Aerococcus sp. YH-aer222]